MRIPRLLLAPLGLSFVLATTGAGCEDSPSTANLEDLAPPLGLTSVTGDGAVTLRWQASNYGEDREGFDIYQAAGSQAERVPFLVEIEAAPTPVV